MRTKKEVPPWSFIDVPENVTTKYFLCHEGYIVVTMFLVET